jgi:SUMO ligase MMS21 Smc5/6 complex component
MSQEETNLAAHVEICAIRYRGIEEKLDDFDRRLIKLETDVSALKSGMQSGFSEIKLLLERQSNARFIQVVATGGTVAASILALVGYILTH